MEQISEYGNVLKTETDQSHGVHRKFHKHDPIEVFPLLDGDMDLSEDAIGSQCVKKLIFPTVQEQLIAKHIKKFIEPDSSAKEALPRVKKFLKDQPLSPTAAKGAKGNGPASVTDQLHYWQDEFPDVLDTPMPASEMPSAPQGPSSSTTPRATVRSAPVTIEEIVFSMIPLSCVLHTKALVKAAERASLTIWRSRLTSMS